MVKAQSHLCCFFPFCIRSHTQHLPHQKQKQSLVQGHTQHILNQWDPFSKAEHQQAGCTAYQTQAVSGELGYISASQRHRLYWALPCWQRNPQCLWLPSPQPPPAPVLLPSLEFVKVIAAPCWWDPLLTCNRKKLLAHCTGTLGPSAAGTAVTCRGMGQESAQIGPLAMLGWCLAEHCSDAATSKHPLCLCQGTETKPAFGFSIAKSSSTHEYMLQFSQTIPHPWLAHF